MQAIEWELGGNAGKSLAKPDLDSQMPHFVFGLC